MYVIYIYIYIIYIIYCMMRNMCNMSQTCPDPWQHYPPGPSFIHGHSAAEVNSGAATSFSLSVEASWAAMLWGFGDWEF